MSDKSATRASRLRTRSLTILAAAFFPLIASVANGLAQTPSSSKTAAVSVSIPQSARPVKLNKPYYIEFRARSAQSYGHTFSVFGKLNAQNKIVTKTVAGLHPATESPIPWMIGHVLLVPSETGASDGDNEDQYVIARFRVLLSEAEYGKVTGYIKTLQDKSPVWHAVLYNCNAFVGDIAHFMGLETPGSTMAMPEDYIDKLRDLNIARAGAPGVIGTPVQVENAAALRAVALREIELRDHAAKNKGRSAVGGGAIERTWRGVSGLNPN